MTLSDEKEEERKRIAQKIESLKNAHTNFNHHLNNYYEFLQENRLTGTANLLFNLGQRILEEIRPTINEYRLQLAKLFEDS